MPVSKFLNPTQQNALQKELRENEDPHQRQRILSNLEKLAILKADNVAGEWNLIETKNQDKSYLAVEISAIWDIV